MRPVYDEAEAEAEARWCETETENYRGHEAKMHENEATTHEAEAKNYNAKNEVKAVKFGLKADPASRT